MNYQMTIWKAGLCLLLSFSFLSQPLFASEEGSSTTVEEIAVGSDNPIMIIRCRFDEGEGDVFTSNTSKKISNSKDGPICDEGYYYDNESHECVAYCDEGYTYDYYRGVCVTKCGFGFKLNESGGCVPDCNSIFDGVKIHYEYNSDTGLCDCQEVDDLKGNTNKEFSDCTFCPCVSSIVARLNHFGQRGSS